MTCPTKFTVEHHPLVEQFDTHVTVSNPDAHVTASSTAMEKQVLWNMVSFTYKFLTIKYSGFINNILFTNQKFLVLTPIAVIESSTSIVLRMRLH